MKAKMLKVKHNKHKAVKYFTVFSTAPGYACLRGKN